MDKHCSGIYSLFIDNFYQNFDDSTNNTLDSKSLEKITSAVGLLEFEWHLYLQAEISDYVATIEWRMKIQIQQDKPHRKWTSIA